MSCAFQAADLNSEDEKRNGCKLLSEVIKQWSGRDKVFFLFYPPPPRLQLKKLDGKHSAAINFRCFSKPWHLPDTPARPPKLDQSDVHPEETQYAVEWLGGSLERFAYQNADAKFNFLVLIHIPEGWLTLLD